MAHSLNNTSKQQFMARSGSHSTKPSRRGVNLLGWDSEGVPELQIEEQLLILQSEKHKLVQRLRGVISKDERAGINELLEEATLTCRLLKVRKRQININNNTANSAPKPKKKLKIKGGEEEWTRKNPSMKQFLKHKYFTSVAKELLSPEIFQSIFDIAAKQSEEEINSLSSRGNQ